METNWWGGSTGGGAETERSDELVYTAEKGDLGVGPTDNEVPNQESEKITDADNIRAMVAVSRGESELYIIKMPPVDFSLLEVTLAGDIYKIMYEDKIYGYTSNPKIFKIKNN